MGEQGNFRRSINGFNKTDVLEYIDAIQAGYSAELSEYQKQIGELKELLNNLKNENEQLKAENEQLKKDAEENIHHAADLRRLTEETEALRREKNEHLSEIADLQQKLSSHDELNREVEQLRAQLKSNSSAMRMDASRIEESERTIKHLRDRNDQLLAMLRQEKGRSESLEIKLAEMEEKNKKFNGLVGDAGAFILEMYSMGQRFLEIAYKRSDGCLESLEQTLETLTSQVAVAGEKVKNARQELLDYGSVAGLRLDELMQSLEMSAGIDHVSSADNGENLKPILVD